MTTCTLNELIEMLSQYHEEYNVYIYDDDNDRELPILSWMQCLIFHNEWKKG